LPNEVNDRGFKISQEKNELESLCKFHDYDFKQYKGEQSVVKMARNLVDYEAGKTIFETALNIVKKSNTNQISIFDEM
jgi:DNA (cytosine-5)-methyltransferase 1